MSTHEFVPLAQYSLGCRFARVVVLKLVCLTYALVVARFPSPSELAEEVQCSRQTLGPAPEPTTRGPGDLGMPASCDQWQERGIEEWLCAWGGGGGVLGRKGVPEVMHAKGARQGTEKHVGRALRGAARGAGTRWARDRYYMRSLG